MSVTMRNRGRAFEREGGQPQPKPEAAADKRLPFERVETLFHVALALTIAAGLATMLSRGGQAPQGEASERGIVVAKPRQAAPATPAADDPAVAIPPLVKTPALMAALAAMPANAPEPLSPPTPDSRDRLEGRQPPKDGAAQALAYAPTAQAAGPSMPDDGAAAEEGPTSKCYVKLSGRVAAKGSCRVRDEGERITFELPGKTLSLAHDRGRIWTATLDGRVLGKAYRRGACWAAPRVYVCDRG